MRWPVLLIGIVLVAGVVIFAVSYGSPTTTSVATSTAEILPGVASVRYENTDAAFSLLIPATISTQTSNFEGYLPVTAHSVVGFPLPAELFQGTNLVEAGLYIGAAEGANFINACPVPTEGEKFIGTKLIGSTEFSVFRSEGAAAGNRYESTVYRTVRNGSCYELVQLLHSGNIGNYPDGQVQQFDHDKYQRILDAILATFAFTANAGSGVEGMVHTRCSSDATDTACAPQILTIEAYQGPTMIGLFKTTEDGMFRSELPPGQYELRVAGVASTTHCASVGIVVPDKTFISTNISCDVGE